MNEQWSLSCLAVEVRQGSNFLHFTMQICMATFCVFIELRAVHVRNYSGKMFDFIDVHSQCSGYQRLLISLAPLMYNENRLTGCMFSSVSCTTVSRRTKQYCEATFCVRNQLFCDVTEYFAIAINHAHDLNFSDTAKLRYTWTIASRRSRITVQLEIQCLLWFR